MTRKSRILELATIIRARTEEIEIYLVDKGLPSPAFDVSVAKNLPSELHAAQHALLEASDELTALVQGPSQSLAAFAYEVLTKNSIALNLLLTDV